MLWVNIFTGVWGSIFNPHQHNGRGDLSFRNALGKPPRWVIYSITSKIRPDADSTWKLFASAELNGEGPADMVLTKPDHMRVVWLMKAAYPQTSSVINAAEMLPIAVLNIKP
jgi:hypothetical protein